jgi:hypothetical protein
MTVGATVFCWSGWQNVEMSPSLDAVSLVAMFWSITGTVTVEPAATNAGTVRFS